MERLLHHDAVDHMASVTRIAWLNGAFSAADEIERLRQERDEARQRYCIAVSEHGESAEAQQIAKDEGWDCFKEDSDV